MLDEATIVEKDMDSLLPKLHEHLKSWGAYDGVPVFVSLGRQGPLQLLFFLSAPTPTCEYFLNNSEYVYTLSTWPGISTEAMPIPPTTRTAWRATSAAMWKRSCWTFTWRSTDAAILWPKNFRRFGRQDRMAWMVGRRTIAGLGGCGCTPCFRVLKKLRSFPKH